jgi:hypothetical protein
MTMITMNFSSTMTGKKAETNVDRIKIVDNNDNPVPPKLA